MSHPETWRVDPLEVLKEQLGTDVPGLPRWTLGPEDSLHFSISHGYMTFKTRNDHGGGSESSYALHPGDGLCHANPDDVSDTRDGICVHCGSTLM